MMDYDELKKAIKLCIDEKSPISRCEKCKYDSGEGSADCLNRIMADAADALTALTADNASLRAQLDELKEANRWVPVTERLPEDSNHVIVMLKRGRVDFGYYDTAKEEWWDKYDDGLMSVSHWRPLPSAPEQETGK
jgi:hypothetical protein